MTYALTLGDLEMSDEAEDCWIKFCDIEANARVRNLAAQFLMDAKRRASSSETATSISASKEEKSGAASTIEHGAESTDPVGRWEECGTGSEFEGDSLVIAPISNIRRAQ